MTILDLLRNPITDCFDEKQLDLHNFTVLRRWALRCARDVEHLDKDGRTKECNDVTERYLCGRATKEELGGAATYASKTAAYVGTFADRSAAYSARDSAQAASRAAHADDAVIYVFRAVTKAADDATTKTKYHKWLIEMIIADDDSQSGCDKE